VLKTSSTDWGPKPFRSIDVWQSDERVKDFVISKWQRYEVQGSGIYVLKEKLKKLKADLKVWNKDTFGNLNQAGEDIQRHIQNLHARDDESELDEERREERRILLAEQRGTKHR